MGAIIMVMEKYILYILEEDLADVLVMYSGCGKVAACTGEVIWTWSKPSKRYDTSFLQLYRFIQFTHFSCSFLSIDMSIRMNLPRCCNREKNCRPNEHFILPQIFKLGAIMCVDSILTMNPSFWCSYLKWFACSVCHQSFILALSLLACWEMWWFCRIWLRIVQHGLDCYSSRRHFKKC